MEPVELFAARLSRLTNVELRETAAAALAQDIANCGGRELAACVTEARRRGKKCLYGHAYVEIMWGPDVADQLQAQCCTLSARDQVA